MNSERSRLSGVAVDTLATIAPRLNYKFETLTNILIPTLIKLTSRSTKIYVTRASKALQLIISQTKLTNVISHLKTFYFDKSQTMRLACIEGLLIAMEEINEQSLRFKIEDIELLIKNSATDSNADIRNICKKIYLIYTRKFYDRVDNFTEPLTPVIRKYLSIPAKNTNRIMPPKQPKLDDQQQNEKENLASSTLSDNSRPVRPPPNQNSLQSLTKSQHQSSQDEIGAIRFSKSTSSAGNENGDHRTGPSRALSSSTYESNKQNGPSRAQKLTTTSTTTEKYQRQQQQQQQQQHQHQQRPRSVTPTSSSGARRLISNSTTTSNSNNTSKSTSSSTSSSIGARRPAAGVSLPSKRTNSNNDHDSNSSSGAGYTRFAVKPNAVISNNKLGTRAMAAGVRIPKRGISNVESKNDEDVKDNKKEETENKTQNDVNSNNKKVIVKKQQSKPTLKESNKIIKEGKDIKDSKDIKNKSERPRITKPPIPKFVPVKKQTTTSNSNGRKIIIKKHSKQELQHVPSKSHVEMTEKAKNVPLPDADKDELCNLMAGLTVNE